MVTLSLPFQSVQPALLALPHRLRYLRTLLVTTLLVTLAVTGTHRPGTALGASVTIQRDSLYVGDESDSSVKRFDAQTGHLLGPVVQPGSGGLDGPRGILPVSNLVVANQNEGLAIPGEIDEYNHVEGDFLRALVPHTIPNAPFHPDGIILGPDQHTLYVADLGGDDPAKAGAVERFDVNSGTFLGTLDFSTVIASSSNPTPGEFHPRGLVFGPNGLLYVSIRSLADPVLGGILSYNLRTGAAHVVASYNPGATDCSTELHRPDGLTFGPDGKLYVTSFRANSGDIDRILIFNNGTGACLGEIDLDQAGQPRAFAQYLLFGPGGSLFVPIAGNGPDTGTVRRYDVTAETFTNFVAPGGPLGVGWGLTFGHTNPNTLAYSP